MLDIRTRLIGAVFDGPITVQHVYQAHLEGLHGDEIVGPCDRNPHYAFGFIRIRWYPADILADEIQHQLRGDENAAFAICILLDVGVDPGKANHPRCDAALFPDLLATSTPPLLSLTNPPTATMCVGITISLPPFIEQDEGHLEQFQGCAIR